jgi:acetyl esterase/lipase
VRLHRNVVYATRPSGRGILKLRMDIHVPCGSGPYPLVIFLPGGGFVVCYLRAHAGQFQIAPARVALWGQSAGGYLATMTALTDDDQQLDIGDNLDQASTVSAVIDMFGPSDLPGMAEGFDERTIAAYEEISNANSLYVLGSGNRLSLRDAPDAAAKANPLVQAAC